MNNSKKIHIAEALPGSGKSTKFIEMIPSLIVKSKLLYAMPTNALIKELALDIQVRAGINPLVVTSETTDHVVSRLENVLASNTSPLVMVTHEALRRVDPRLLDGWELVMDEVPSVSDCKGYLFDSVSYAGSLAPYMTIGDDKKASLRPEHVALVETMIKSRESSALSASALDVLKNRRLQELSATRLLN
ncbi:DEAD/DEAH box helicase family protein [Pseudomonas sp.]|uniref:DEAD/DEAH box helicase family protein n=1 Tax=Pseudomonas sp. TaxID=306 RepID=UPI003981C11F